MNNERKVKWLEDDQNMRLADTGLNPRADLTGHRLLSGKEQSAAQELADDFVEKFGFEVIVKPDSAGRAIYGRDKFTLELRIPQPEEAEAGDDAPAAHPLQLYTATVDGDPVVRVRYGSVWGMVPDEVDGGSAPASFTPSNGLKVWAEVTVDADGLPVDSAIASGEEVPADTATTGHFLIGQVAVSGSVVTLYQSVTHSLNGQCCGTGVYNWWGV